MSEVPRNQILIGDCIERMRELPDGCIDSVVTDPPYHLTTGKKGGTGLASVNLESPYGRARVTTGFMGKAWDGGDVAFRPETWAEVLRVAKPGAYLLAFGGTRTYHRLTCAIEDAGWEIRDCIMWVYGSGFPKSLNLDGEREGWGTALKPAFEPIIMARKPLVGTVAKNVAEFGTGAMNIDASRIATDPSVDDPRLGGNGTWGTENAAKNVYEGGYAGERVSSSSLGRWPANLIHDGSDEVLANFPHTESGKPAGIKAGGKLNTYSAFAGGIPVTGFGDKGSAARFFYCAKASQQDRDEGLEDFTATHRPNGNKWTDQDYRVTNGERSESRESGPRKNTHPTVKPTALMRYLCKLVTPPSGLILDPFTGSGSTGKAARLEGFDFLGMELSPEYAAIAEARSAATSQEKRVSKQSEAKRKPSQSGQLSLFEKEVNV